MSIEVTPDTRPSNADLAGAAHTLDAGVVAAQLGVDPYAGLSALEAERCLAQVGPNTLIEAACKSKWAIIWEQLTAVMVLVLIAPASGRRAAAGGRRPRAS